MDHNKKLFFGLCLIGLACFGLALDVAAHPQTIKPEEAPAGVDAVAWSKFQDQIQEAALDFASAADGVYAARNPAKQLSVIAERSGIAISFNQQAGLKLRATALEDDSGTLNLPEAQPISSGRKVEYIRGPVTEWYLNHPQGLEQGFTIYQAADGSATAPAATRLWVAFNDDLTVQVAQDGQGAAFCSKGNGRGLSL